MINLQSLSKACGRQKYYFRVSNIYCDCRIQEKEHTLIFCLQRSNKKDIDYKINVRYIFIYEDPTRGKLHLAVFDI